MSNTVALIREAQAWTAGDAPGRGEVVPATKFVDVVSRLGAELERLHTDRLRAILALEAPDGSEEVPDHNEWADAYRVRNALKALGVSVEGNE